jgi:hypothetical protein
MDDTNASPNEACSKATCCRARCCWIWGVICVVVLVGAFCAFVLPKLLHDHSAEPPLLKANAKQLKATVISPVIEAPIQPGKNVLWCSTFQLVWNESCRYAGGDIHLKDEPPIVAALNKKLGDEKDVDANSCLVMAGLVQDGIVGEIRRELDQKFRGQADPELLNSIEPRLPRDGWTAYAYLFRELPFECPFDRLEEPLTFGGVNVASFGLQEVTCYRSSIQKAKQITVLDYKNDDDFIVAIQPKERGEQIVLAKIAPGETLQKTIETVRSRVAAGKLEAWLKSLHTGESIAVPILNFDLLQEYDELVGKTVATSGPLQGMPIVLAVQSVRLRLDERGATLKSEADVAYKCAEGPESRHLVFDKPFLILLERKGAARPYFALWVDNPELLVPFR